MGKYEPPSEDRDRRIAQAIMTRGRSSAEVEFGFAKGSLARFIKKRSKKPLGVA